MALSVAKWLKVDLHAHTPFDEARNWGRRASKVREQGRATAEDQARQWLDRCVDAALDIVAVTDHNRLDGYDQIAAIRSAETAGAWGDLLVLPGVELSVGGCHFLVVGDVDQRDWLGRLIGVCFGSLEPHRRSGAPEDAEISIIDLARRIADRDAAGHRVLAIPAHIDKQKGLAALSGLLKERAFSQRAWSGFQVRGRDFHSSRDLLRTWASGWLYGRLPEELGDQQTRVLQAFIERDAWPFVDASDPETLSDLGAVFTWLKMSAPGVEGIRQALLDPGSRLRRHHDEPPSPPEIWIERIEIQGIDIEASPVFDQAVEVELSPALNTLIGGRGTGKSTIVELLRWALDRTRQEDFAQHEREVTDDIVRRLSRRSVDGGILGDESRVRLVLRYGDDAIEVVRTTDNESTARRLDGGPELDVRTIVQPRIVSQRQIGEIANDPRALRREVDNTRSADLDPWRSLWDEIVRHVETLHAERRELIRRLAGRSRIVTEMDLLRRKIETIERVAESDDLVAHRQVQTQARWLGDLDDQLNESTKLLPDEPLLEDPWPPRAPEGPARPVLDDLQTRLRSHAERIEQHRKALLGEIVAARSAIDDDGRGRLEEVRRPIADRHEALISELRSASVDLGQLDDLHAKVVVASKDIELLDTLPAELEEVEAQIDGAGDELATHYARRRAVRQEVADRLADADADIRLVIEPHGDRAALADQRERWWGGTRMRKDDWSQLVDWVHDVTDSGDTVPRRWWRLIEALRADHDTLKAAVSDARATTVRHLVSGELTGYLEGALRRIDEERFDEMQRYLPEDNIEAEFRDRDGQFRAIGRGSLGQRNTAILSLLLQAGSGPLLLDQPEDDLDNRYIYDVVVDLLRATKTARQVIAATHNANIPVNGDAECIVALDPFPDRDQALVIGSLEQPELKEAVSSIMEGSESAFRLRRQRYGY